MSNINRDYLIVLNPKTSKVTVPELNYYIYDKYTANLFVNLVTTEGGKVVNLPDADQYKLVLHVLKPTNEIQDVENIQVFNKEKALFQIELDHELTKNIGRYKCELLTIDKTDHIVQSAKFSYRVKKSIYNDLDVVTETPEYPIIIRLLDKLQDIDKYEEERRANEVARVAAEKARVKDYTDLRQTVTTDIETMQEKIDSFDGKVQEVDNALQQMTTNINKYQTEKNKELDNYKTQKDTQINTAITNMENTIDTYKTEKDTQINDKISQQDTKIDSAIDLQNKNIQASTKALNDKLDAAIQDQNDTIATNNQAQNKVINDAITEQNKTINTVVESDKKQNDRLDALENSDTNNKAEIKKLQDKDAEHEDRMTAIEAVDVEQNNRLDAIEIKNDQQDGRLNDVEAKNKKQDLDLKCLFAESHSERITLDDEVGNSVFLQNSKQGFATVDELKGNTLVNCNKDTDKELILNGNIDTSGYTSVTTTEGVDGGKVDVSLEGNTMVNVCDQEDPVAITKAYTVETGNHIALQGEYDGKCRPNVYGNTLVNLMTNYKDESLIEYFYPVQNEDVANVGMLKPNTEYTLIYNAKYQKTGDTGCVVIYLTANSDDGIFTDQPLTTSYNQYMYKFTTPSNVSNFVLRANASYFYIKECILLEGDYTNKPIPNYFTGMKSSFEDKLVPENLYKFSSRDDFYLLSDNVTLDGEYIKTTANSKYQNAMIKPLATIKPSTTYTIAVDVVENTLNSNLIITANVNDSQLSTTQKFQINTGKTGIFTQVVTTSNDLSGCTKCLVNYLDSTNTTGSVKYRIMVVEGDYTNYDFTNYDSTKAGKYKVDYKVTGKNKFDGTWSKVTNSKQHESSFIKVNSNTEYIFSVSNNYNAGNTERRFNVRLYDKDKKYISLLITGYLPNNAKINTPYNCEYIKIINRVNKDFTGEYTNIEDCTVQLEEGTTATTYEPYKESIKTLYLNSPLLEGDTIEQSGNNIIHNHRYTSVVLDGSEDENWTIPENSHGEGYTRAYLYGNYTSNKKMSCTLIADVLPNNDTPYLANCTYECVGGQSNNKYIYINLKGDNLSNNEIKSKLKQNPITVVYELAQPTQEIISNNDNLLLDSYTNGHLDVDSVVPIDKVDFRSTDQLAFSCKYLYNNTSYTVQFESDSTGLINFLALGQNDSGALVKQNVVKGLNKLTLNTGNNNSNYFYIDGIGFNASKIVVTPKVDNDFGYFKGMKSVGECEDLEVVSNKMSLPEDKIGNGHTVKPIWSITYNDVKDYLQYFNEVLSYNACNNKFDFYIIYENNDKQKPLVIWINLDTFNKHQAFIEFNSHIKSNKQTLTHEPLRGLPNGVKDKYVIIDGKWYIERNCGRITSFICDGSWDSPEVLEPKGLKMFKIAEKIETFTSVNYFRKAISNKFRCITYGYADIRFNSSYLAYITFDGNLWVSASRDTTAQQMTNYLKDCEFIYELPSPIYEPIDYNPFEVYTDITHISNNSTIPCNMVIRNSGFNCILKPNTTYTVSSNNGLSSVVTKDSIGDSVLRFYDKDTTSITKMNKVLVLEGDYVTGNPPIPAFFKGMESAFEQELVTDEKDEHYGKYKVNVKAVGKNLFGGYITDFNNYTLDEGVYKSVKLNLKKGVTYTLNPIEVSIKGNYFLLSDSPNPNKAGATWNGICYDGDKQPKYTFTYSKDLYLCYFNANGTTIDNFNNCINNIKVQLEQGDTATEHEPYKENNITFYINEPLRGVGNVKDKVYVKEDKVVVERNCGSVTFDGSTDEGWVYSSLIAQNLIQLSCPIANGSINDDYNIYSNTILRYYGEFRDSMWINRSKLCVRINKNKLQTEDVVGFKQWLQENPTTVVYQLATPVYEEVEYFDLKLFVEIFKNTTINYNSNIPVTSTINYTYSTPLTDSVNTVSDISDQQDSLIIDMATQVASMEMMLM